MSYSGGSAPGQYWPGGTPSQNYRGQASNPQLQQPRTAPQYMNASQPQTPSQSNNSPQPQGSSTYDDKLQQQAQYGNANATNHSHNSFAAGMRQQQQPTTQSQTQHYQQPQFISPAQLLHQPSFQQKTPDVPHTPILSRKLSNISTRSPISTATSGSSLTQVDTVMLLVSLAEEYFEEARKFAPMVASSMTSTYVAFYEQLVATGLGCLEAVLKRERLTPRLEANIRLRYAGVLLEETENVLEAETTLIQGIALCERNHYFDVKYAMQFLLARSTARKNVRAALKALEGHVSEAQVFEHFPWVYAFRFLRTSLASKSGSPIDNKASIHNLQAIAKLADQQGDQAVHLTAALMEALTYLKSAGPDALENLRRAIAAAWAHQMDKIKIPQLQYLTHLVDLIASIRHGEPQAMREKLKVMRTAMDDSVSKKLWTASRDIIAIPMERSPKSSQMVSADSRMVVGVGSGGGDNLIMTFLSHKDASALLLILGGVVLQHGLTSIQRTSSAKYLQEGIARLEMDDPHPATASSSCTLPLLRAKRAWRGAEWVQLRRTLNDLNKLVESYEISLASPPGHLMLYLTGLYHQGVGDLDMALHVFQDKSFDLDRLATASKTSHFSRVDLDIGILAALNRLWILQHADFQDFTKNALLTEKLQPFCENHSSPDIQGAFNLILATVATQTPTQTIMKKKYMGRAIDKARITQNFQLLSITLNVMCSTLFDGIIGQQAENSAQAASVQSNSSGNPLWMSIADETLARCYELQGKTMQAEKAMANAIGHAEKVFADPEKL